MSNIKTILKSKNNEENEVGESIKSNTKERKNKPMIIVKYLKDNSYDIFNEIFSEFELQNLNGEKITINNCDEFYIYQIELNSNYKPKIDAFDYTNISNISIIKEIPYKATKLRKLYKEDSAIIISPNGNFVRSLEIENNSESTLSHYNTVIGNALILNGVYYYEIKLLELKDNIDICLGIISRNSDLINDKKYRKYPLSEFENCYGFNLNNILKRNNENNHSFVSLSVGSTLSIKIDLDKCKLSIFLEGKKVINNSIDIKDGTLGYYPAFSLSSGKEIQVKFGGIYNQEYYFNKPKQLDIKPICQYNNLEKIVSCYMKIVENNIIKIINHEQILYNDCIRFFCPMINFFANIAFNDEYIMKEYILKFMYKNYYDENKEPDEFFEERYTI